MTPHPPLPERHEVKNPLFVNGRAIATCNCHYGTPLTESGELPRRAHLKAVV